MHGQRGTFVRMYMPTFAISNTIRFTSTKTDAFRFSHPQRRLKTFAHSDPPRVVRLASGGWRPAPSRVPSSAFAQFLRSAFSRGRAHVDQRFRVSPCPASTRGRTAQHFTSSGAGGYMVRGGRTMYCDCALPTHTRVTVLKRACPGFLINHRRPLFHSMTRTAGFVPLCCSGGDYTITRHYQRLLRARKNKVRVGPGHQFGGKSSQK